MGPNAAEYSLSMRLPGTALQLVTSTNQMEQLFQSNEHYDTLHIRLVHLVDSFDPS